MRNVFRRLAVDRKSGTNYCSLNVPPGREHSELVPLFSSTRRSGMVFSRQLISTSADCSSIVVVVPPYAVTLKLKL